VKAMALAIVMVVSATAAYAAPYDGSTSMDCAIETVTACSGASVCVRGTADTVLLPPVVRVDVPGRVIMAGPAGGAVQIVGVGHGAGRLLLHGEDLATSAAAWNVIVDETSGAMTGAVVARVGGYLLFGTCSAH
jgi:hypothetical protein